MAIGQTLMLKINAAAAAVGAKQFQVATGTVSASALTAGASVNKLGLGLRTLAGGFLGLMVIRDAMKTMVDFEKSMRTIEVVTRKTGDTLTDMSKVARQLGASTRFTATEAADGMIFLARAGFEASDVMAMIPHTLNLATAAVIELGAASDMVANTIHQFGLKGRDAERVVDSLMNTANSFNTTVFQLGNAMQYAGTFAGALGISIEETNAALGVMANSGIKASMAGTSLRGVFASLIKPTDKAMRAITALGLTSDDVNPAVLNLEEVFKNLNDAGQKLGDTTKFAALMLQIFGRRPVPGALALAKLNGEIGEAVKLQRELAEETARAAAVMDDSLFGSLKQLRSAIQETWLSLGDNGLGGALRTIVDVMVGTARMFAGMGESVEKFYGWAKALSIMIKVLIVRFAALVIIKMAISLFAGLASILLIVTGNFKKLQAVAMTNWVTAIATGIAIIVAMFWEWTQRAAALANQLQEIADAGASVKEKLAQAAALDGEIQQVQVLTDALKKLEEQKKLEKNMLSASDQNIASKPGFDENYKGRTETTQTYNTQMMGGQMFTTANKPTTAWVPATGAIKEYQKLLTKITETQAKLESSTNTLTSGFKTTFNTAVDKAGDFKKASESDLTAVIDSSQAYLDMLTLIAQADVSGKLNLTEDALNELFDTITKVNKMKRRAVYGLDTGTGDNKETEKIFALQKAMQEQIDVVDKVGDAKRRAVAIQKIKNLVDAAGIHLTVEEEERTYRLNRTLQNGIEARAALTAKEAEAAAEKVKLAEAHKQATLAAKEHTAALMHNNEMLQMEIDGGTNAAGAIELLTRMRAEEAKTVGMGFYQKQVYLGTVRELIKAELELKAALDTSVGAFDKMNETLDVALEKSGEVAEAKARERFEAEARNAAGLQGIKNLEIEIALIMVKYDMLQKEKVVKEDMLITNEAAAQVMTQGIMDVVKGAKSMEDAFASVIIKLVEMIIQAMIYKMIMGVIAPEAAVVGVARQGMVMSGGSPTAFATGGVVHRPTMFPMANGGVGLMGEAGAEAIMPLTRMPSGDLGVKTQGGGGKSVIVNMNITTKDADSFRKSQKQVTREMGRSIRGATE